MQSELAPRKRPAPRGTAAYPRKRAVAACQTCRSRKTKCDNRRPICSFCEGAGATCIYSTQDLSAYDPASLAILDRLDQLESTLKDHVSANRPPTASAEAFASPDTVRSNGIESIITDILSIEPDIESADPDPDVSLLPNTIEDILAWPVFQGRFNERLKLMDLLSVPSSAQTIAPVSLDLDVNTCNMLSDHCLEHILSKNPVLEEDYLRSVVSQVCLNGVGWDVESCLVLIVSALGCIAPPTASDMDWAMARSYFSAAQRRMGALVASDGLISAQCYFLAGVYYMYILRPLEAWRLFAQAVVCIYPDNSNTEHTGCYSLKECVYWSSWKSEVELRMHLRLPSFGIISNRYPPHMPEPPKTDHAQEPKWFYYIADISSRRLDLNIHEALSNIARRRTSHHRKIIALAHAVPALEEHLEGWTKSMPIVFRKQDFEENVLALILRGRVLDSYETLYMPFLQECVKDYLGNLETSAVVETYARKALCIGVRRLQEQSQEFSARHHGTWLMLRACTRSAFLLLATRVAGRIDLLPEGWEEATRTAVSVLNMWKDVVNDASDRLQILQELAEQISLNLQSP